MWLPVLSMLVLLSPVQAVADLADLPWQLQLREDGIEVYTAVLPDSRIRAFRGVARIDAPLADVAALIADTARMPDWFPDTEHAATIMDASGTEYAYTVTDAPWPVADRDVVLHASSSFDAATHSMRIDLRAVPDARWDVYALGALLYHMLTGAPPYRSPQAEERLRSAPSLAARLEAYRDLIRTSPAPDEHRRLPGIDPRLIEIVDRCLAKDPEERYPNAQAVLERLRAREQHRARAPFLKLGVLGPLLLLAAMAPLFVYVMRQNVQTLEEQLTERALESDALTARVQAQSLQDDLAHRISELEDVLANPLIVDALQQVAQRPVDEIVREFRGSMGQPAHEAAGWIQLMDEAYNRVVSRAQLRGQTRDTSWFLTSAEGTQIWRRGRGNAANSLGQNYSFRDYFHGRGGDLPRDQVPDDISMFRGENHVSTAFRSDATDRYMVAVTVKVRGQPGPDGTRPVIGLLGRTTHLDEFRGRFVDDTTVDDQVNREIALADTRTWQLLDHPWIAAAARAARSTEGDDEGFSAEFHDEARRLFADPEQLYSRLKLPQDVVGRLESLPAGGRGGAELRVRRYRDPVAQVGAESAKAYEGTWLAALYRVRVGDADWVVIIQEPSDRALGAVGRMTTVAMRYGLLAILLSIGVILLVWWFVMRSMKNPGDSPGELKALSREP